MIFLGLLYRPGDEEKLLAKSKVGLENQVVSFQYNLINGFIDNQIDKLEIVSALPVGTWKKNYSDLVLETGEWKYRGKKVYEIGCINLPGVKQIQRRIKTKRLLKELIKHDEEVIMYSAYLPYLSAVNKLPPNVKITCIVPDLPEYSDHVRVSLLHKILRKIENILIYKCLDRVDSFVLLTEQMQTPMKVGQRPFVVVEGICDDRQPNEFVQENRADGKEVIFYAGALHIKFGLKELVDGFELIDRENVELWLCGEGDANAYIEEKAARNERIKFYGYVSSDEVKRLRSKATVLINPRPNEGEYTKYSFPSKTMEYMVSGIPTVMHKLDGVPDEYDEYLCYIKGNTSEDTSTALNKILDLTMEERILLGEKARSFVVHNKNREIQTKKILDMLHGDN